MVAAIVLTTPAVPLTTAVDDARDAARLDGVAVDRYVTEYLDRTALPGAVVAVTRGPDIQRVAGYGHDSTGAPITAHSPLPIAAVSMPFTALAVTAHHPRKQGMFIANAVGAIGATVAIKCAPRPNGDRPATARVTSRPAGTVIRRTPTAVPSAPVEQPSDRSASASGSMRNAVTMGGCEGARNQPISDTLAPSSRGPAAADVMWRWCCGAADAAAGQDSTAALMCL